MHKTSTFNEIIRGYEYIFYVGIEPETPQAQWVWRGDVNHSAIRARVILLQTRKFVCMKVWMFVILLRKNMYTCFQAICKEINTINTGYIYPQLRLKGAASIYFRL